MKIFFKALITFILLLMPQAQAVAWSLDDAVISRLQSEHDRFVFVPKGQKFANVALEGKLDVVSGVSSLQVHHNGKLVSAFVSESNQKFSIEVGDLEEGFHQFKFTGTPYAMIDARQGTFQCPVTTWIPYIIKELRINYRVETVRDPFLADLPDALFNPVRPGPIYGYLSMSDTEGYVAEAAARLLSYLSGYAPITWLDASDGISYPPGQRMAGLPGQRFLVHLQHDENLSAGSFLEIRRLAGQIQINDEGVGNQEDGGITHLDIYFRDREGLRNAIYTLISDLRQPLQVSEAYIDNRAAVPTWGRLKEFDSLEDFGLSDVSIRGRGATELFLQLPPHWRQTDVTSGTLRFKSRHSSHGTGGFDIWRDQILLASVSKEKLAVDGSSQDVSFVDSRLLAQPTMVMRFDSRLAPEPACNFENDAFLWVDSAQSVFTVPHRIKSGVAGYIARFAGFPSVTTNDPSAGFVVSLNKILDPVRFIMDSPAIPITVSSNFSVSDYGTVHFEVSEDLHSQLLQKFSSRLPAQRPDDLVFVQSFDNGRVKFIARPSNGFKAISTSPDQIWRNIEDGVRTAAIDGLVGIFTVLEKDSLISTNHVAGVRFYLEDNRAYFLIAAAFFGILLILVTILRFARQ